MSADGVRFPATVPALRSERLDLRGHSGADVKALFAVFSNEEAMRYWGGPPMRDPEEARAMLARVKRGFDEATAIRWGIVRREDDALIGTCTLFDISLQNRRAEMGYILDRRHWGKGYMGEALATLLDYAFAELRLHRVEADVDPRNGASVRVLERLGFVREGLLRERWRVADEVSDTLMLAILARDWRRDGADRVPPLPGTEPHRG